MVICYIRPRNPKATFFHVRWSRWREVKRREAFTYVLPVSSPRRGSAVQCYTLSTSGNNVLNDMKESNLHVVSARSLPKWPLFISFQLSVHFRSYLIPFHPISFHFVMFDRTFCVITNPWASSWRQVPQKTGYYVERFPNLFFLPIWVYL
jgi:hypothetical protein